MSLEDHSTDIDQNQRDESSLFSFDSSHNHKWSGALAFGALAAGISYVMTFIGLLFFGMSPILGQMSIVLMMAVLYYYSFRADNRFFILSVLFALVLVLPRQFFIDLVLQLPVLRTQANPVLEVVKEGYSQLFLFTSVWDILFFVLMGFGIIFERVYRADTWRGLYRLLLATIVSMVVMAVVTGSLFRADQFLAVVESLLPEGVSGEVFQQIPLSIYSIAFVGAQGIAYFINLMMACWLGRIGAYQHSAGKVQVYNLVNFYLPAQMVWGLILSLALLMFAAMTQILELMAFSLIPLVFTLFLFGLQGMGIIRYLLTKRASSSYIVRLAPLLVFAVLAAINPNFLMIMIGIVIPGLGVSEIWIKYRKSTNSTRGNQNESDS